MSLAGEQPKDSSSAKQETMNRRKAPQLTQLSLRRQMRGLLSSADIVNLTLILVIVFRFTIAPKSFHSSIVPSFPSSKCQLQPGKQHVFILPRNGCRRDGLLTTAALEETVRDTDFA